MTHSNETPSVSMLTARNCCVQSVNDNMMTHMPGKIRPSKVKRRRMFLIETRPLLSKASEAKPEKLIISQLTKYGMDETSPFFI
jgi:hypothetical protein